MYAMGALDSHIFINFVLFVNFCEHTPSDKKKGAWHCLHFSELRKEEEYDWLEVNFSTNHEVCYKLFSRSRPFKMEDEAWHFP